MVVKSSDVNAQIRAVRFLPQDLELTPQHPSDLIVKGGVNLVLASLFGLTEDGGRRVDATLWNALKIAAYGSGFMEYDTITGTAPAAYGAPHGVAGNPSFHRVDINALTAPLLIRVKNYRTEQWGHDIYVGAGFMSLEIDALEVQVKLATGTASDYYLTIFW
jgi:hypothetical protein